MRHLPSMGRRAALQRAGLALATPCTGVVALGACSTPAPLPQTSELRAGGGLVAVRVVNLSGHELKDFWVQAKGAKWPFQLQAKPNVAGRSVHFLGMVPAGRYATSRVSGHAFLPVAGTQRNSAEVSYPLHRPDFEFDVQVGRLTNLGTIVLTPVPAGRFEHRFVAARDKQAIAARDWLAVQHPALLKAVATEELGWANDVATRQGLDEQLLKFAASKATYHSRPRLQPDGSVWRGGLVGAIQNFTPELQMKQFVCGTTNPLLDVLPLEDGRVVATGEGAYVAVSSPDRRTWEERPVELPKSAVGCALVLSPRGEIHLVMQGSDGLTVWKSSARDIRWQLLHRVDWNAATGPQGKPLAWDAAYPVAPSATSTASHLIIVDPRARCTLVHGWAENGWTMHEGTPTVSRLQHTPDGALIGVHDGWHNHHLSDNLGASWRKLDNFNQQTNPAFEDRTHAYMVAASGWDLRSVKGALRRSSDGGASWLEAGPMPTTEWLDGELLADTQRQRLLFLQQGRVWVSNDAGASWR